MKEDIVLELLRSESRKTLTTKGTFILVASAIVMVALVAASTVLSMPPEKLDGPIHDQVAYFVGSIVLAVFALVMGVRSFTDEFRHGTIVSTVLAIRSRTELLVAKAIVAVGVTLIMSILGLLALVGVALGLSGVKGGELGVESSDWTAFVGFVGAMLGWTVLGIGLGAMVRNQVAGVVGALVWVLVVENFASGFVGEAAKYMPGQLAHAIAGVSSTAYLLAVLPAAALFIGYAVLLCLAASVMLDRRDVI